MDVLLLNAFKSEVFNGLEIYAIKPYQTIRAAWMKYGFLGSTKLKPESSRERALKPKITFYTFE